MPAGEMAQHDVCSLESSHNLMASFSNLRAVFLGLYAESVGKSNALPAHKKITNNKYHKTLATYV